MAGVEEGRCTFDNIRKALVYLLATNTAELGMMLIAALLALPLPLLPMQLLWINLVTDALPALALAMDPPNSQALGRPPRDPEEPLLGRTEWLQVGFAGAILTAVTLAVFISFSSSRDLATARSVAFGTLVWGQLWLALASRNARRTYFVGRPLDNLALPTVALGSALAHLLLSEFRITQRIFQLPPWHLGDLSLALGASLVPVTLVELAKLALSFRAARRSKET